MLHTSQWWIYIYKAEKLSVCMTDNSPGTAHINILTSQYHKPIIPLLQVSHCEWVRWSDCVLQWVEDEEVEKTWATNHNHMVQWVEQPILAFRKSWVQIPLVNRFFSNINTFCTHVFKPGACPQPCGRAPGFLKLLRVCMYACMYAYFIYLSVPMWANLLLEAWKQPLYKQ